MRYLIFGLWLILGLCGVIVGSALLAGLHPLLDAMGIWLIYAGLLSAILIPIALICRRWVLAGGGLLLATAALALLLPHFGSSASRPLGDLFLVQHNVLYTNDADGLAKRIGQAKIVTLQEVNDAVDTVQDLGEDWTVQQCPYPEGVGEPAVLTRLPVTDQGCVKGGAWARIETNDGPVTVLSLHLHLPWPRDQAAQVTTLMDELRALPRPVIVAGDFNQSPWSDTLARLTAATDTTVVPGLRVTHTRIGGLMRMPIDHVLVPNTWRGSAKTEPSFGSDHRLLESRLILKTP